MVMITNLLSKDASSQRFLKDSFRKMLMHLARSNSVVLLSSGHQ